MIMGDPANWLLYDGDCPFCRNYVRFVRLRETVGDNFKLLNARERPPELREAQAAGLDINDGMVLKYNGHLYHGDECIHQLGLMSTPSGTFNRLNAWIFRSQRRSRLLYPVLRFGRNLTLRILRVQDI